APALRIVDDVAPASATQRRARVRSIAPARARRAYGIGAAGARILAIGHRNVAQRKNSLRTRGEHARHTWRAARVAPGHSRHCVIQRKEKPAMASIDASPLIGTWKQLSGTMVEEGSTSERSNLSAAPNGFVNFSADGRLILLSTDSARKKPAA